MLENKIKSIKKLIEKHRLNENHLNLFSKYISFLYTENQKYNLTGFKTEEEMISGHIEDTLNCINLKEIQNSLTITDIGTGCGVPGLILAIVFPEKKFYLIEVVKKKINFLQECIKILELKNCIILDKDFKTCIRKNLCEKTTLFLARASLSQKELFFIFFDQNSKLKNSYILYWSSKKTYEETKKNPKKEITFESYKYIISEKERYYVLFSKTN
jgi:16S rRNA (guanine(527)-N(7))-methyltransferase RsmG